jgi:expansin
MLARAGAGAALLAAFLCACARENASCATAEPNRAGEGTYYAWADGTGACGFDAVSGEPLVAAMNHADYSGSSACGACVHAVGPKGEVDVRIVDECPGCSRGDLDFSPEAFERIARVADGRVPISWRYVPCPVSGPIRYHFKEGSSRWWTALQIRNHRHRIRAVSWRGADGSFTPVEREDYNFFVVHDGMGPGPYTLRIEDVYGHAIVDEQVPLRAGGDVEGNAQLPACPES